MSCPICLSTINNPVTTFCEHTFCASCIETWRQTNDSCPLCRRVIWVYIPDVLLEKIHESHVQHISGIDYVFLDNGDIDLINTSVYFDIPMGELFDMLDG